ncbi:MAG: DUF1330 domain-containing protein [Chloroflexi bacterium]|jgi:uncharacterized protein (DUF1330 family)|nr:DUF1330 domain-containing protein [Chloroflexota bacterium]MBT4073319.1 DUF1330 domain-containing protein [Chloroflexota bacterium]MBT4514567.1 DUF1330 domain-containing protein [Chloroflexota bacterium]MBT5319269.1 DUF1330 domain-containing protein [Chloroflexota bacterium]MBT6682122.1 DUF1330 domain-containing protein [Chloroflexota bacterium]
MAVYTVAEITIKDEEAYKEYQAKVPATIEMYGGRYLVRGGEVAPGEGDWNPGRVVILEFPDAAALQKWATSPEYAPVAEIRHRAADTRSFMVQGV